MFERIACIVNPAAGSGRADEVVERIRKIFLSRGIRLAIEESRSGAHAAHAAKELASEHEVVTDVGGDGTVNDVANGIIASKAARSTRSNSNRIGKRFCILVQNA